MEYIIDFKHQDLMEAFKTLSLPDYYGHNLDALYDVLTEINEPTLLKIKHFHKLSISNQEQLIHFFEDVKEANNLIYVKYIK